MGTPTISLPNKASSHFLRWVTVAISIVLLATAMVIPVAAHADQKENWTLCGVIPLLSECSRPNSDGSTTVCTPTGVLGGHTCTVTYPAGGGTDTLSCTYTDALTGQTCQVTTASGGTCTITQNTITTNYEGTCENADGSTAGTVAGNAVADWAGDRLMDFAADIILNVSHFFLVLGNWMLGFAGTLFNWVLVVTVFQFGSYFGNTEGILLSWGVLRDLANIMLLFGFIFMGLQTILDIGHFNVKHALPRLLIIAVLLNFSLFITEALIDVTNVFSATMATQAGTGCDPRKATDTKECVRYGIAGKIVQTTGLTSLLKQGPDLQNYNDNKQVNATIYLGAAIFAWIAAFVLFAGAVMLLIRALVLVFVMVLSPLGFAAMAIPAFEELGDKWRHALISNVVSAPVFILMILVSIRIVDQFQIGGENGSANLMEAIASQNSSALGVFVIYLLIIGFFVAAIVVSKQMGAMGASFATRAGGAMTFGTSAFVARRTIGQGGAMAEKWINGTEFGRTGPGRMLANIAGGVGSASFDVRNAKIVKDAAHSQHIELGETKGHAAKGFKGIEHHIAEERAKHAKNLKQTPQEERLQKIWAKEQEKAKEQFNQKKEEADAEMDDIVRQERDVRVASEAELNPLRTDLDRKKAERDAAIAAATGSTDATVQERAKLLDDQYRADLEFYNQRRKDSEARIEALRLERESIKRGLDKEKAKTDEYVAAAKKEETTWKQKPTKDYIDDLKRTKWYSTPGMNFISVGGHADHEAAEKLKKELNKSPDEKLVDRLNATIESKLKNGGGDNHGKGGDGHGH